MAAGPEVRSKLWDFLEEAHSWEEDSACRCPDHVHLVQLSNSSQLESRTRSIREIQAWLEANPSPSGSTKDPCPCSRMAKIYSNSVLAEVYPEPPKKVMFLAVAESAQEWCPRDQGSVCEPKEGGNEVYADITFFMSVRDEGSLPSGFFHNVPSPLYLSASFMAEAMLKRFKETQHKCRYTYRDAQCKVPKEKGIWSCGECKAPVTEMALVDEDGRVVNKTYNPCQKRAEVDCHPSNCNCRPLVYTQPRLIREPESWWAALAAVLVCAVAVAAASAVELVRHRRLRPPAKDGHGPAFAEISMEEMQGSSGLPGNSADRVTLIAQSNSKVSIVHSSKSNVGEGHSKLKSCEAKATIGDRSTPATATPTWSTKPRAESPLVDKLYPRKRGHRSQLPAIPHRPPAAVPPPPPVCIEKTQEVGDDASQLDEATPPSPSSLPTTTTTTNNNSGNG